jgi:putative serine protease PepD
MERGLVVYEVERPDPSAADTIVAINGEAVDSAGAFVEKLEEHRPGEQIVLTIIRDGQELQVPVTLGAA